MTSDYLHSSFKHRLSIIHLISANDDFEMLQLASLFLTGVNGEDCLQINIFDDNVVETNETFSVLLTSPDDAVDIDQTSATTTIIDDDTVIIHWSSTSYTFEEDSVASSVCAELIGELARPVTVHYSTSDTTALSNL